MKPETINFKKPVAVIQVFNHQYDYLKDQRRFEERKDMAAWQTVFQSNSGYLANGELYLPESILEIESFEKANVITLEDFQQPQTCHSMQPNHCLHLQKALVPYDCFKLKAMDDGGIEVHLHWSFMGYFDPEQYKIAELHPKGIIEIRRNRVANATLTGRKARTYTEAYTIIQHLGTYNEATLLRQPIVPIAKPLPQPTKVVDLMKRLY